MDESEDERHRTLLREVKWQLDETVKVLEAGFDTPSIPGVVTIEQQSRSYCKTLQELYEHLSSMSFKPSKDRLRY